MGRRTPARTPGPAAKKMPCSLRRKGEGPCSPSPRGPTTPRSPQHQHLASRPRGADPDRLSREHGREVPRLLIEQRVLGGGEARHAVAADTVDPGRRARPECRVRRGGQRGPHGDHRPGNRAFRSNLREAGAFPWAIHRSISQSAPPSRDTRMTRDAAGVPSLPPAAEASMTAVTADVNERTTRAVRGRAIVAKMLARDLMCGSVSGRLAPAAPRGGRNGPGSSSCTR
jgi:hypothetical protein